MKAQYTVLVNPDSIHRQEIPCNDHRTAIETARRYQGVSTTRIVEHPNSALAEWVEGRLKAGMPLDRLWNILSRAGIT